MPAERTELDDKIRTPPCTDRGGFHDESSCLNCQVDFAREKLAEAGNDYPSAGELAAILPEECRAAYWRQKLRRWMALSDDELHQIMATVATNESEVVS